jgi:Uma2 family endonuclease
VCAVAVSAPWQKILTVPPLIVIEILSPEDTLRKAEKKAGEYARFGVGHVWVIDPAAREASRYFGARLEKVPDGVLAVPGTPIVVRVTELFEKMDRMRARAGKQQES